LNEKINIIEITKNLPSNIEELIDFEIVTSGAIQSFKAKLRACSKSDAAKQFVDITLRDGRRVSRLNIEANARLGELLEKRGATYIKGDGGSFEGTSALPVGVDKKQSHYAQEIYKHPELVETVFNTKLNDIPTKHDILKAIKENKREAKIQAQKQEIQQGLEQPEGLFDIIVIDPPWHFDGKYDADGRRTTATYPQMSYEEIKNIQLPAKDDCVLWLWTTHKDIWMAKQILEHWDFDYKGMIIWDKEKMGIGTWLRFQCEFCLLGIRGKPLWENKGLRDIIREPRTTHSRKPEIFYKTIEDNFIGRKLDYFYGKKRKGWEYYGTGENSISE